MSFHHHILAGAYYPVKLVKSVGGFLNLTSPNRLRILLYHDVAPQEQERFANQLSWLMRTWNFVSPEQFVSMVAGDKPIRGSNLLLTFDDGFASNRVVAEKILNPMGIHALFFVVSDFAALSDREEARNFIAKNIRPGSDANKLPAHLYNMSWGDLEALLEQGHSVGGHTRTHARLSQVLTESDLAQEIVGGAKILSERLGVVVDHFAYTFGDVASFSERALAVAQNRFRFVHSGLRGDNMRIMPPYVLKRDSVCASDTKALVGAFLEGAADFKYNKSYYQLNTWTRVVMRDDCTC